VSDEIFRQRADNIDIWLTENAPAIKDGAVAVGSIRLPDAGIRSIGDEAIKGEPVAVMPGFEAARVGTYPERSATGSTRLASGNNL